MGLSSQACNAAAEAQSRTCGFNIKPKVLMKIIPFVPLFSSSRSTKSSNPKTTMRSAWRATAVGVACLLAAFRAWSSDCASAPAGLVAWWSGEGNANDMVGVNNGVLQGGVAFAAGKVGQAFSFDGFSGHITNGMGGLPNVRSSYTMEFWAWPTATRASTPEARSGTAGTSDQRYAIFPQYGVPELAGAGVSVGINGVSVFEHAFAYLPSLLVYDGPIVGWTHIAVVYQNQQPALYVNGGLVRTGLVSSAISYPSTSLGEGDHGPALHYGPYAGLLDEVSIYNRALSAATVQAIYNAGSAGKCRVPPTNGLAAYYPFTGNANDASGNGMDGVVYGAALTADRFDATNRAYRFNGTSWVRLPDAILPLRPSEFTMSAWVLADSGPHTAEEVIIGLTPRRGQCALGLVAGGRWGVGVNLQASEWQTVTDPINTNRWTQIVGVYKQGQYMQLWVNGYSIQSNGIPDEPLFLDPADALNSAIGLFDWPPGPNGGFYGAIDDARIYSRALSDYEVQQLYLYESGNLLFIASQPRSQVGYWGKSVTFTLRAISEAPLSYQWCKEGTPIAGATSTALVLTNLQITDAGIYTVVVTNVHGSVTSNPAILTMNPAGVSLALYSGITIEGVVGLTYGIQYSTDLSNANGWLGLTNVTLGVPTHLWYDSQPATQTQRYYRVVPGPISIP